MLIFMKRLKFEEVFGSVVMVMGKLSDDIAVHNPRKNISKLEM